MHRLAIVVVLAAGCGAAVRPFDVDAPIVWHDDDRRAFSPRPAERRSAAVWDAADGVVFRGPMHALAMESPRESVDVNALDEVPDSSWFENRIGRAPMTPDDVARGACDVGADEEIAVRPWTIVRVKTDGVQPGFVIEDATGARFLLKVDSARQPERATAAEAIVAALVHASGYHVPCNRVVFFSRSDLRSGDDIPDEAIRAVLDAASRAPDGSVRASLSRFLPGAPLGPWSYDGRWDQDPNDLVPHELRREVRALRYFSAWVDHVDARAHNTLSIWIETDRGRGYVQHSLIDFGDCFGAIGITERRSARYGHVQWLDSGAFLEDLVTLGTLPRAWYREVPRHAVLGDFPYEPFDPDLWRPNHANGAFEHAMPDDAAWAARIIARFDQPHLRAAAELGRYEDRSTTALLVRALASRRNAILERYLTQLSPLSWPSIAGGELCLEDLAVSGGIREASARRDRARVHSSTRSLYVRREGERLCVRLPNSRGYHIIDVISETSGVDRPGPARVHVVSGARGSRVVGLERPADRAGP